MARKSMMDNKRSAYLLKNRIFFSIKVCFDYIIDVVRQSTFWKTQKILFHKGISIMAVRNVTIKKKGPKGDTKTIHMKSYGHAAFDLMLIQPSMR